MNKKEGDPKKSNSLFVCFLFALNEYWCKMSLFQYHMDIDYLTTYCT